MFVPPLTQSIPPITRLAAQVRDGDDVNRVRQNFINQPVGKSDDATRARGPVVKRKPLWVVLNPGQHDMHSMKEPMPQLRALAFVIFGRTDEFDIRLAVVNDWRHEMACNASRITS